LIYLNGGGEISQRKIKVGARVWIFCRTKGWFWGVQTITINK
jgi:hypothetical protein